jgi:transcriptional regulator
LPSHARRAARGAYAAALDRRRSGAVPPARGNALPAISKGGTALIVVNGPDAYVSPRWYDNRDTVPTWDYVALELEGRVRRMADEGLEAFLHAAIAKHEARLAGAPWRAEESSEKVWSGCFAAFVGFELEVLAWRPTFKLSQNKPAEDPCPHCRRAGSRQAPRARRT